MAEIDARGKSVTDINRQIRTLAEQGEDIVLEYPDARHHLCVGVLCPVKLTIRGSTGYFCAGLCDGPTVEVENNVGWAAADNLLSGTVIVGKNASAVPGMAMRGGTLIVRGDIGSRAGTIMKEGLLVAGGKANFMAGYMMLGGRLVICGDSGPGVGQNMIGGAIYVGGEVESLGDGAARADVSAEENEDICSIIDAYGIKGPRKWKKIVSSQEHQRYAKYESSEGGQVSQRRPREIVSTSQNGLWNRAIRDDIFAKSQIGRYRVRGYGAFRKVPSFEDLTFKFDPEQLSSLHDVRKRCNLRTKLGGKFGGKPLDLAIPIMIAPMSYGALSKNCKIAMAQASTMAGIATATGEGGMMPEERAAAAQMIYQCLSGRYGFNPHDMNRADGIELYISQGAKPGLGGQLMAKKITPEIAAIRGIPVGIDLRSPSRHPDVLGADDLVIKIEEFREATDWRVPISLKIGAGRLREDIKIALKDKVDFVAIDGMQGGTGASSEVVTENVGIPSLAGIVQAIDGLAEIGRAGELQIVLMGGIRSGLDAAKAIALGADVVSMGTSIMIAAGCISCMRCHVGSCIRGIATQKQELVDRLDIEQTTRQIAGYLEAVALELAAITVACGKSDVHDLDKTDLLALTPQAAEITDLPLMCELSQK